MTDCHSSHVVQSDSERIAAGVAHGNTSTAFGATSTFPTPFCDGRDPCERPESVIVSLLNGCSSLGEHCGADDRSHSWHREKDRGVTVAPFRAWIFQALGARLGKRVKRCLYFPFDL